MTDSSNTATSKNTADPYWIDYVACLVAKETCTPLSQVLLMPYGKVLSYVHCILRYNGNDTRWTVEDEQQVADDIAMIDGLL